MFGEWLHNYILSAFCSISPDNAVSANENVLQPIIFNKTQEREEAEKERISVLL